MPICRYALLISLALVSLATHASENDPSGFRGIAWGADLSPALGELTLIEENGQTKLYTRPAEKLAIGAAEIKRVAYAFDNHKFTSVIIESEGATNNIALLEALKAQFGSPIRPNRFMEEYYWKGKITTIWHKCRNSAQGECTTYFLSNQNLDAEKQNREQKAKDSAQDF